jgi:hypothetical protein
VYKDKGREKRYQELRRENAWSKQSLGRPSYIAAVSAGWFLRVTATRQSATLTPKQPAPESDQAKTRSKHSRGCRCSTCPRRPLLCIKRNGACEAIGATCGPELPLPLHTMGDIDGPPHMPDHTIVNSRSASRRASHTGPSHMSKTLRVKSHARRRRVAVGQVVSITFDSSTAFPPLRLTARPMPCPLLGMLSHCLLFSVPGALQQRVDFKLGITEEWLHALLRRTLGAACLAESTCCASANAPPS